jgi:two-component system NtrC family sensor kinase
LIPSNFYLLKIFFYYNTKNLARDGLFKLKFTMRLRSLSLSTKFSLAIGIILIIFCTVFSILLYYHLKERLIEDANEKTRIILAQMDAVGDYVNEELRPAVFRMLKEKHRDDFIVEAMSTTHVRMSVMRRFNKELGEYVYRRCSRDPLNPANRADSFHEDLITFFEKNMNTQRLSSPPVWNGIVKLDGEEYLIRAKPVIVQKGCLICHGRLKDAPEALIKRYKRNRDFLWKEGDIMGVESVSVPLATALGEIKGIAVSTFVFGALSLFFLFLSIHGAFWSLVSRPLSRLTSLFRDIVNGTGTLNQKMPVESKDEIGELINSFNQMAGYLYEAQEAMRKNAETLRTIFEGISDPLALINPDCTVELTNQAYRTWSSLGVKAVFSERCDPHNCDPDTFCPVCFLKRLKEERRPISELWEDENGRHYYIHLYPIFNQEGEVIKAVHYVKDITERRQIEEQMRLTEKLAAIGQLTAGLAHEINNPLGGIRLCFNNLISLEMDEETKKRHIEVINTGLQKIHDIIKQLLDFSKQTELVISSASVNSMVEDVLKLAEYLIEKKRIRVIKEFSEDIPQVRVDRNKIEQVFLNIILNAIQAMDGREGVLTIKTLARNGRVFISFSDTGPGIPDEILPRIFDPFFTTKPVGEGTGLGLSVSKSIVEQHNGVIRVDTSKGGTTFTVELPLREGNN